MYQLITSDIMNWLNLAGRYGYKRNYYHAMLLDPPYHLTSITKRSSNSTAAKFGKDGAFQRASKGFMGQTWDGGDLAFNPELWLGLKEMLLPGAFCFAFAGSRGWHRMATAIEDAGFIMHPTLWNYWSYGSGFPKATRIDTQIDKAAGMEREVVGEKILGGNAAYIEGETNSLYHSLEGAHGREKTTGKKAIPITAPATPEAAQWEGHRYGLQAIKPAVEPILCFQKPYEGRPIDSITQTGAGALNIDGGRIGTDENDLNHRRPSKTEKKGNNRPVENLTSKGRWPSNLLLQHSPECIKKGEKRVKGIKGGNSNAGSGLFEFGQDNDRIGKPTGYADPDGLETVADWQCVDDCPVKKLGEQSGESESKKTDFSNVGGFGQNTNDYGNDRPGWINKGNSFDDKGTAARFFHQSHFAYEIAEQIAAADPVRYVAKAGKTERNAGLDSLPNQFLATMGDGIGKREYNKNEPHAWVRNIHPTVKPIALTKYLASLLLPPEAYTPRRILIPFAGSGSEMIGALLAGWDEITGIEMTKQYIPIAKARLEWWASYLKWGQDDIDTILATINQQDDQQLSFIEEL